MMGQRPLLVAFALLGVGAVAARPCSAQISIALGRSSIVLAGPWRFATGDDPRRAAVAFDDRRWQTLRVGGPPAAHDPDVGLTGYAPGWAAQGHAGYAGFAWYRTRVRIDAPPATTLALAGPADVDDAYEVYVDGRLLGGIGDFAGPVPVAFSIRPQMFELATLGSAVHTIAIRTWMGPAGASDPDAGGMHVAPLIGVVDAIDARVRLQWLELVRGFALEVAQAFAFVALAVTAAVLAAGAGPRRAACGCVALALVLSALLRANLAFFSWTPYESVAAFALFQALATPVWFGAWAAAELAWLPQRSGRIAAASIAVLTVAYLAAQIDANASAISAARLAFLALFAVVAFRGALAAPRAAAAVLPPFALLCVGLFASELSQLGVPEIWFPYGTGVSRTQFAYAAFDVVAFAALASYSTALLLRVRSSGQVTS